MKYSPRNIVRRWLGIDKIDAKAENYWSTACFHSTRLEEIYMEQAAAITKTHEDFMALGERMGLNFEAINNCFKDHAKRLKALEPKKPKPTKKTTRKAVKK